jgi:hypothetical protein
MRLRRLQDGKDQAALPGQTKAVLLGERCETALAANLTDERHILIANQMRPLLQMTCN